MAVMDPFLPDDEKVAAIRALLPATGAGIYLDVPSAGPLPAETDRALREADDWELRVGRGGPDHAADAALRRDEARGVVAAILGTTPDRVLPVMGIRAAVAAALSVLEPVDAELTILDGVEPALADAVRVIAGGRGWRSRDDEGLGRGVVVAPAIRVDDGTPVDLAVLAGRVHAGGGLLVADLTLAAASTDPTLPTLGADAAVLATDRWLLGPDGTAAAWLPAGVADRAAALADPLPRRAALGLGRSVGWLLMYVGLPWAVARTTAMARHLRGAFTAIPGVSLRGAADLATPVSVFTIGGWTADEAGDELGRRVFAITGRTPDGSALRVGVGCWTTMAELDRFAAAVREIAAHTPDTLPRKPPLTVLGGG